MHKKGFRCWLSSPAARGCASQKQRLASQGRQRFLLRRTTSTRRKRRACERAKDDHQPRRGAPHEQQQKCPARKGEVGRVVDGRRPDRTVEGGEQEPDDGGIHAEERSLGG